jgi:hypothetical protein
MSGTSVKLPNDVYARLQAYLAQMKAAEGLKVSISSAITAAVLQWIEKRERGDERGQ